MDSFELYHGVMERQLQSFLGQLFDSSTEYLAHLMYQEAQHHQLVIQRVFELFWREYPPWTQYFKNGRATTMFAKLASTCKRFYNICQEYCNPYHMSLDEKRQLLQSYEDWWHNNNIGPVEYDEFFLDVVYQ